MGFEFQWIQDFFVWASELDIQVKSFVEAIEEIGRKGDFQFGTTLDILIVNVNGFHVFGFAKIQLASELVITYGVSLDFHERVKVVTKSFLLVQEFKSTGFSCR